MSLTIDDIRDAAFLAGAAYDIDASAESNLANRPDWQYVNPAAFRIDSRFVDQHHFLSISFLSNTTNFTDLQALLAYDASTHTLAVSFRGSTSLIDFWSDIRLGIGNFGAVYSQIESFVLKILDGATSFGATRILVTGHSLGGALAEELMARHSSDSRLVGVTFGSPGINEADIGNALGSDQRLINIGHVDLYHPHVGDPVYRVTPDAHVNGGDVRVDLQGEPDYNLATTAELALAKADYGQHEMSRYQTTANLIARELDKNLQDGHPFDVRAFSYVVGTHSSAPYLDGSGGNNVIIGASGADVIFGVSGNDVLDGGSGNDTIYGGPGNDIIYGGPGNDTAIFTQSRSQYAISVQRHQIVVAPVTSAAQIDGTDTVNTDTANDGVENFKFADGTYTLAQLLPPPDTTTPVLASTSPIDNATNVMTNSNIVLTFSEPVFRGSGNIEIRLSNGSLWQRIVVSDSSQIVFSGSAVSVNPAAELAAATGYYITIDSGAILDQAGNAFVGISSSTTLNFSTSVAPDIIPPSLSSTSPQDNAIAVAAGANIQLQFSESVTAASGNIDIHNADGSIFRSISATDTGQVSISGNQITINPSVDLSAGSSYYVTIAPGAIRDLAGNSFSGIASSTTLNFTTQSSPDVPPPNTNAIFLSITDTSIREGNVGEFLTLSFGVSLTGAGAGTQTVSVQYSTQDIAGASAPATAGVDYRATSSVLVIPAGQTFGTIDVTVFGDNQLEPDEVFRLALSQPSQGVTLLRDFGTGFINNDDQAPNHSPITGYDLAVTAPNTPITMDVLANDTDPDGDALHLDQIFGSSLFSVGRNESILAA